VDEVSYQPFVYSSDFPHEVSNEMCKEEIQEVLANEALSDEAKEGILHGNSEQLYNLAPVQV
jgi:predicted TIM-barrel fold metal-dependent hydrolase